MRRSICLLTLVAAAAAAPLAFAQDQAPQVTDAGAPTASVSATAPAPQPTTPPPTTPPPPVVVVRAPPTPRVSEETVYQLGRLVELEAERARGRRYVGSAIAMVTGAGIVASGAVVFTLDGQVDPNTKSLIDVLGGIEIGLGGLVIVEGLIDLFVKSPMEKMFDAYAPVAVDKRLSPEARLRRGEALLEAMAEREHAARILGIASGIVGGLLDAALGVWLIADNDFWGTDPTLNNVYRPLVGTVLGLSVASIIGDAIAKALWERGPAELAWEHWKVSHEPASVQTSQIHVRPLFAPTLGGAMGGLRVTF